ncbi:MAG: M28 family peptidase [Nitrospira sp.]|nr:M28 family peptidase [Nitrospira sp.]
MNTLTSSLGLCAVLSLAGCLGSPVIPNTPSTPDEDNWLDLALTHVSDIRMMDDIRELSGPRFSGRQTGTDDDRSSATFVADRLAKLLNQSQERCPTSPVQASPTQSRDHQWTQTAPVTVRRLGDNPLLYLSGRSESRSLRIGSEFLPILDSPSADLTAPIVFVGYGISDQAGGYDDYTNVDVRNAVVLFLRGKPETYSGSVTPADKERIAREKGALAYLTATPPLLSPYERRRGTGNAPTAFYSGADSDHQLPGAWISTAIADAIIRNSTDGAKDLADLQKALSTGTARSFSTGITAQLRWTTVSEKGTLHNVIARLPGCSVHADETVIIGAHRDHFGRQGGVLFAGADDNASGTAVMLEVARILASAPIPPKRSILLISFSGEEQGLLGSRLYVSQPTIPLASTVAMVNIDHAGIGNGRLTVGLTNVEKHVALTAGQAAGLDDRLDLFSFFPGGDHVPFHEAGVPTITIVSGGSHPHFHQPTDTADTLDSNILRNVARYVLALSWRLANGP